MVEQASIRASQLSRELALLLDRRRDCRAPVFELGQISAPLFNGADLNFVETAGRLLAVARDERHGVLVRQKRNHSSHTSGRKLELIGKNRYLLHYHTLTDRAESSD